MMELFVILLVAFLVVGPKDLPKVARWLARIVRKARDYIEQMKDELGWDELASEMKDAGEQLKDVAKEADVTEDVQAAQDALRAAAEGVNVDVKRTAEAIRQSVEEK